MSLGQSTWTASSTGGQVRAVGAQLARAVVHFDVSPKATPNVLVSMSDPGAVVSKLRTGRLAEQAAFCARAGQPFYAMPVTPSQAGKVTALAFAGQSLATITPGVAPDLAVLIKCILGGTIGTASFQFSTDGGVTWSATMVSVAGWSSTGVLVPNTFCTLTFAAATYVATKTNTIGIDGTVTPGSGWVGTVAILTTATSPMDDYEIVATVTKAGLIGASTLQVSLDNGNSFLSPMPVPAGGVVVLPGTGVYLTCATGSGAFNLGESYSFLAIGPSGSTSDYTAALTALKANRTVQVSLLHFGAMPASSAGAFSLASTVDTSVLDAFNNNVFDWLAMVNCPSSAGGMRITSAITGRKHLRPLSWLACERYVETDPRVELAATKPDVQTATGDGSLHIFLPAGAQTIAGPGDIVLPSSTVLYDTADTDAVILAARGVDLARTSVFVGGRDEFINPGLDDAQINTARTYGGPLKAYLSITAGVIGWKILTTNSVFVDAGFFRAINVMVAALRPVAQGLMGQRPAVNPDGTITEDAALIWDGLLDNTAKRSVGLAKGGGDFTAPQMSQCFAKIARSSQLGQTPKRLDINYGALALGEVTSVSNALQAAGVLSINS